VNHARFDHGNPFTDLATMGFNPANLLPQMSFSVKNLDKEEKT